MTTVNDGCTTDRLIRHAVNSSLRAKGGREVVVICRNNTYVTASPRVMTLADTFSAGPFSSEGSI